MSPSPQNNLITISKIPADVQESIRDSFSYQGLVKALNSGIITQEDIETEADFEQKSPDLLTDQRIHTVLFSDLKQNQVKQSEQESEEDTKPIPLHREEAEATSGKKSNATSELIESLGFQIRPGFKGLDQNNNFIEIIEVDEESGWVKFCSFNNNYQTECFSYPLNRFIKYFKENNIFEIQNEDFDLVKPEKVKNLNNQQRIQLLEKIHERALTKLQALKIKKRNLIEKIIRSREDKKLEEILARIRAQA